MKRILSSGTAALAALLIFQGAIFSQTKKGEKAAGFSIGAQQQYNDSPVTGTKFGAEGFFSYGLSKRFNLNVIAGFAPTSTGTATGTVGTSILYLDLATDYALMQGRFKPFLTAGIGALRFSASTWFGGKGFFDGEFVLGGGLRYAISPSMDFIFRGAWKYTTGDNLDGSQAIGGTNDSYFTGRAGLAIALGSKNKSTEPDLFTAASSDSEGDVFASDAALDEAGGEAEQSGDIMNQLAELDDVNQQMSGSTDMTMEEYIRLKSKIDELTSAIERKENEISELEQEAAQKGLTANYQSTSVGRQVFDMSTPISKSNYSVAYEAGLNRFYSRRYQEAIEIFQSLLQKFPKHSLASNCQYWIGENYFADGKYRTAIDAFEKVLQYDRSLKKDDALYMMSKAYGNLGQTSKVREMVDKLTREYPSSEFVGKAQKYLRSL